MTMEWALRDKGKAPFWVVKSSVVNKDLMKAMAARVADDARALDFDIREKSTTVRWAVGVSADDARAAVEEGLAVLAAEIGSDVVTQTQTEVSHGTEEATVAQWKPTRKWQTEQELPPYASVGAPTGATDMARRLFARFAHMSMHNRDFVRWMPLNDLLDEDIATAALSSHAKERYDERSLHDYVELSRSLRSPGGTAYRVIALTKRLVLYAPPWRFNFTADGSALLSFVSYNRSRRPDHMPDERATACLAAVAGYTGVLQLPADAAEAARAVLKFDGPIAWSTEANLRAVTTTHVLVFNSVTP
jgi:hypothetical protein